MKISDYHFPSATGVCEIHGSCYTPDDDDVRLVMAIHHGMAEYRGRYLDFIEYLTANGIAVFMYDMANHGQSNQDRSITGFFGNKDGYKNLVKDFYTTVQMAKKAYPDKRLVVMGHSMGSFIVRCFTAWYSNAGFSAAIYMGTGGANPIAAMGDKISALVAALTGRTKKVKLLDSMAFGAYNSRFEKRTAFDWLSRDNKNVDKYIADEDCGFLFSAQGMNDLIKLNILANTDEWYSKVPTDIDILVISGDMDPVGNYGAGLNEINDKLLATGHSKAKLVLYPQARHEVLNEINKDEVYGDILEFLKAQM